jgi:adenosylmethionine-8-amino-7-oxononanoate aminotransferase
VVVSNVFQRAEDLPVAVSADGAWITGADGRRYLDACGGAIVNGIGHGRAEVADAVARQLLTLDYVHAHSFTTPVIERYAGRLAALLPIDDPRIFPVAGGSEATETALKLARSYHLAKGQDARTVVIARHGSYHGNTLGALDASGRAGLRLGYEPWLGRFERVPAVNGYRCPAPSHPHGCGQWHADRLHDHIVATGSDRVAAFIAEPIGGAGLGATVPPPDYWPAIVEVCRRHDVLVIADEVMTGFGRTGRWFASEHFGLRPDIMVLAKGASSGYWPLGMCVASGTVAEVARPAFHHGYTFSHHPGGAAAGMAVLDIIESEGLVERSASMGLLLERRLGEALSGDPHVGDIRGAGLLMAIEFVADVATRSPYPAADRVAARVREAMIARGVVPYPITGCADGAAGDGILLGPPLIIDEPELELMVATAAAAIGDVLGR